ncbi:zinc-ribbon domain-containing protein [Crenalkalicoccus roseus]|uniref:zinc-ribbon domain-containing protein n=1 Tax=Crenalkalicoccus roseus TaxID=1485588 RepID=UPI0010806A0D|nr:zinc-ribbon domain-containing protein [Crenalkalicoccus roseus]
MRITCPACAAAYEVPDRLVGPGRRLRCARCGHEWAARPEAPRPPAPAEPPQAPAPDRPRPPPHPLARRAPQPIEPPLPPLGDAPPRDRTLVVAWVTTVLVVLGAVVAILLFRAEIVTLWPPAGRLLRF